MFLESVNSATIYATGRQQIPIINNSVRKRTFPNIRSKSFLEQLVLIVLCFTAVNIIRPAAGVNFVWAVVYTSLHVVEQNAFYKKNSRTLQLTVFVSEVRSQLNELTE